MVVSFALSMVFGRSLTGAWIETNNRSIFVSTLSVAPSRGRGLKQNVMNESPRTGRGRSLTGAWIETL